MTHVVDARVDVESLPGAPCAMEQTLPDPLLCVGLVRAVKIAFPGVVGASPLTRMDRAYALQLRRRRMAIAPLQLSPEDEQPGRGRASRGGFGFDGEEVGVGRFVRERSGGDPRNDPLDF